MGCGFKAHYQMICGICGESTYGKIALYVAKINVFFGLIMVVLLIKRGAEPNTGPVQERDVSLNAKFAKVYWELVYFVVAVVRGRTSAARRSREINIRRKLQLQRFCGDLLSEGQTELQHTPTNVQKLRAKRECAESKVKIIGGAITTYYQKLFNKCIIQCIPHKTGPADNMHVFYYRYYYSHYYNVY